MPTSEPLVPTGLPQGSRQEVRAGMQRAGLPLAPSQVSSGPEGGFTSSTPAGVPSPGGSAGAGPLDFLLTNGPEAFPFITDTPPEVPPIEAPRSVLSALIDSSQSEFGRAVATRLRQAQGR